MGSGVWDETRYDSATAVRRSTGVSDFAYSKAATSVHDTLKASRINQKPFKVLESRDSEEHPQSNAILITLDVTGSNLDRAQEIQKRLPGLMTLLTKYIDHPQVSFAANDDFYTSNENCVQFSEFESDNRIDEHIRNVWLIGDGGANAQESYDLILYGAARKTSIDCWEKRGKKGYLFMYADEPIPTAVNRHEVLATYGDTLQSDIPIEEIILEAQTRYEVFVIWPARSTYRHAYEQYQTLFGEGRVFTLENPAHTSELIGVTIGLNEGKITPAEAIFDLTSVGVSEREATKIVDLAAAAVSKIATSTPKTTASVAATGGEASRL